MLGQEVAGDQTGRAGADDHGPVVQRSRAGFGPPESLGDKRLDLGTQPGSNLPGLEVGHLDFHRVHEMEVVMAPGIQALAEDAPVQYGLAVQAKAAGRAARGGPPPDHRAPAECY